MTVFGLALGERRLTGTSLSSGSKSVASMSMAMHTDRQDRHHTDVNRGGHRYSNSVEFTLTVAQNVFYCTENGTANETSKSTIMAVKR